MEAKLMRGTEYVFNCEEGLRLKISLQNRLDAQS